MARPALDNDHRGRGAGLVHPCQASLGGIRDASGGMQRVVPNPRPPFASFTGEKNLTGSVFYILEGNPGQGESPKKFIVI